MLHIGDILDNKYKILSVIGQGGMSVVYLAVNERANKTWAVKEVRKDGVIDFLAVRQSLAAETEMMKRFSHPNLPSIIDVIDLDDSFIIVMDYIEGRSLSELIRTEGPQQEEKVIRWGRQLCSVLAYLHSQIPPVIYRDMKPANIMLKPDGNIVLIDFGTAREWKDRETAEDTTCLGTRGYAAPEQFGGRGQSDARSDIYCLGATLYHLLTGHNPSEPPYEIKPISCWNQTYSGSGLEKLILKCTKPDPEERYQNCGELEEALCSYREEDNAFIQKIRVRFRMFLLFLAAGAAALAGTAYFQNALEGARQSSFEARLEQAMVQETFQEAAVFFKQALEVNASDVRAYRKILEKASSEIANEGRLTGETAGVINDCLCANAGGTAENIDALAAADPEGYTQIMYELGLWYFFMKDNTAADRRNANNYLSRINREKYRLYLEPEQQEMLKMMTKIGEYSAALESDMARIGSMTEYSYGDLFHDLKEMTSGDLRKKVGRDYYCLAVYRQAACWLHEECTEFAGNGISKRELSKLLETIEKGLQSLGIQKSGSSYQEYISVCETCKAARDMIERL